jgi:hypothetical protein
MLLCSLSLSLSLSLLPCVTALQPAKAEPGKEALPGRVDDSLRVIASINTELGLELVHIGQHEQAAGYAVRGYIYGCVHVFVEPCAVALTRPSFLDAAIEMYRNEAWPQLRTAVLLASLR